MNVLHEADQKWDSPDDGWFGNRHFNPLAVRISFQPAKHGMIDHEWYHESPGPTEWFKV